MDKLLSLFEKSSDATCAIDANQRIVYWNDTAERTLGYGSDEAIGQYCWQLFQGYATQDRTVCRPDCKVIAGMRSGAAVENFDMVVRAQDDVGIRVNVSTIPIPSNHNGLGVMLFHLLRPLQPAPSQFGTLRLYFLGPIRVQRMDGSFVGSPFWQHVDVQALLAYLVLRRGEVVPAAELFRELWPQLPVEAAAMRLETAVDHLRFSLAPGIPDSTHRPFIINNSCGYRFNDQIPVWLDVDEFSAVVKRGSLEPDLTRAITILQGALALYRGDFLVDLSSTHLWTKPLQRKWRQVYISALEELGTLYAEQGDKEEAKKQYLSALTLDPSLQSAYDKLVNLALPKSEKADLLLYCQKLAAALRSELDILLSEELRRLLDDP